MPPHHTPAIPRPSGRFQSARCAGPAQPTPPEPWRKSQQPVPNLHPLRIVNQKPKMKNQAWTWWADLDKVLRSGSGLDGI